MKLAPVKKLSNWRRRIIRLILLDVNMPGIGGIETASRIRKTHPETHIVLLTANVQHSIQAAAEELGLGFLSKPLKEPQLHELLNSTGDTVMSELPDISEIESDSLMEIFNIGVGHAAAAMSNIVNEEVRMSVPTIRFAPRS